MRTDRLIQSIAIDETDQREIAAAWRQDKYVWQAVQQPGVTESLLSLSKEGVTIWSPAVIGFASMGRYADAREVGLGNITLPDDDLKAEAADSIRRYLSDDHVSLVDALRIACATIDGVQDELETSSRTMTQLFLGSQRGYAFINTIAACLLGLTGDLKKLVQLFAWAPEKVKSEILIHAIITNIAKPAEQVKQLLTLSERLGTSQRAILIRELMIMGRQSIAKQVAAKILEDSKEPISPEHKVIALFAAEQYSDAVILISETGFQTNHTFDLISNSREELRELVGVEILHRSYQESDADISKTIVTEGDGLTYRTNPVDDILHAKIFLESGNTDVASKVARAAALRWADQMQSGSCDYSFALPEKQLFAVDTLVEMGLSEEACYCGLLVIDRQPIDLSILTHMTQVCKILDKPEKLLDLLVAIAALDPQNPDVHKGLFEYYSRIGNWDLAVEEVQIYLTMAPKSSPFDWLSLGRAAYEAKQYDTGLMACDAAIDLSPENSVAHALLGKLQGERGNFREAEASLQFAIQLNPDFEESWMALQEVYCKQGMTQKAIELLKEASVAIPERPNVEYTLGLLYLETGASTEAVHHLRNAIRISKYEKAPVMTLGYLLLNLGYKDELLGLINEAGKKLSNDFDFLMFRSQVEVFLGDTQGAIGSLWKAHTINPSSGRCFEKLAEIIIGTTYQETKPTNISSEIMNGLLTYFKKEYETCSEITDVELRYAELLRLSNKFEEALPIYQHLYERVGLISQEMHELFYLGFAATARHQGDAATSLSLLDEIQQSTNHSLPALKLKSEVSLQAGLPQQAVSTANEYLLMSQGTPEVMSWYAEILAGAGELTRAISALQSALELEPFNGSYLTKLAALLNRNGRTAEAIDVLRSILKSKDVEPQQLILIARHLSRLNDFEGAVKCYEKAINLSPHDLDFALVEMASCLVQLGKHELALTAIQAVIKAEGDSPVLKTIHSMLLESLGRFPAAIGALDDGESEHVDFSHLTSEVDTGILLQDWQDAFQLPTALYCQKARLFTYVGNIPAALDAARLGLAITPDLLGLRLLAVELALTLEDYKQAESLISGYPIETIDYTANFSLVLQRLILQEVEVNLYIGKTDQAEKRLRDVLKSGHHDPMVLFLIARVLGLKRQIPEGREYFQQAKISHRPITDKADRIGSTAVDFMSLNFREGDAAVALGDYDGALDAYGKARSEAPSELRSQMSFAKLIVRGTEEQYLCSEIGVVNHCPGIDPSSPDWEAAFEQCILLASRIAPSPNVDKWLARGKMAFHPTQGSARIFASMKLTSDDFAALLQALRRIGLSKAAYQIGQKVTSNAQVRIQQFLALSDSDEEQRQALIEEALRVDPENPIVHVVASRFWSKGGKIDRAIEEIKVALSIWNDEPEWHQIASELYQTVQDFDNAILHLEKACGLQPGKLDYQIQLGNIFEASGNHIKAYDVFVKILSIEPDHIPALRGLIEAALGLGKLEDAFMAADRWSRLDLMDTRPLVIAGEIHLQLGHFDKAEKNAKEAYRRDCLDPRAVVLLADVYLKTGKGSEALDIIEKAMGSGKNAELYMVAKVETTLKVYGHTTALPLAEDLVKRLPESASAWRILAQTYFSANMQQDAQSAAKTALKISPFDSRMRVLLGNISAAEGQLDQAISHYVDAIHVRPDEIDAYLALAKVYESRREFQEALKVLNQAVELKPRDNRPYLQAAQMYKEARDYQSAEQILRLASGVLPEEPTIQRQLLAISALNLVHKSQKAGAHQ